MQKTHLFQGVTPCRDSTTYLVQTTDFTCMCTNSILHLSMWNNLAMLFPFCPGLLKFSQLGNQQRNVLFVSFFSLDSQWFSLIWSLFIWPDALIMLQCLCAQYLECSCFENQIFFWLPKNIKENAYIVMLLSLSCFVVWPRKNAHFLSLWDIQSSPRTETYLELYFHELKS